MPFSRSRKEYPITTGLLDFFPDAIADVARVSLVSTNQHHPGESVHWDRDKSTDEADALVRHLMERGTRDSDGLRHTAKVAWRALALLQREIEADQARNAEKRNPMPSEGRTHGYSRTGGTKCPGCDTCAG